MLWLHNVYTHICRETGLDMDHECLRTDGLAPRYRSSLSSILPDYGCLILSPANIWRKDSGLFQSDGNIVDTVRGQGLKYRVQLYSSQNRFLLLAPGVPAPEVKGGPQQPRRHHVRTQAKGHGDDQVTNLAVHMYIIQNRFQVPRKQPAKDHHLLSDGGLETE